MTKIALVTGASRGIGASVARALAEDGFAIAVNYRAQAEPAAAVVAEIEGNGGKAVAIQADVANEADVVRLFQTVDEQLGRLDLLVNNAGIHGPRSRIDDTPLGEYRSVLQTNVVGLIQCSMEAIKRMSTKHGGAGGCIINISSGSAYIGNPGMGVHYSVSKGAVNSFTIGASQELASEGIRVNAVSPGLTRTDMPDPASIEGRIPAIPMGRVGEPEEIAAAVAWLASEKASYTSGANIRVSGGRP